MKKRDFAFVIGFIFFLILIFNVFAATSKPFDKKDPGTWTGATNEQLQSLTAEELMAADGQSVIYDKWDSFKGDARNQFVLDKIKKAGGSKVLTVEGLGSKNLKLKKETSGGLGGYFGSSREVLMDDKGRRFDLGEVAKMKDLKKVIYNYDVGFYYEFEGGKEAFVGDGLLKADKTISDSKDKRFDGLKWSGEGQIEIKDGKVYLWNGAKIEVSGGKFILGQFRDKSFKEEWRNSQDYKPAIIDFNGGYITNAENTELKIKDMGTAYISTSTQVSIFQYGDNLLNPKGITSVKNFLEIDMAKKEIKANSDGYFAFNVEAELKRVELSGSEAYLMNGEGLLKISGNRVEMPRDIKDSKFKVDLITDGKDNLYSLSKNSADVFVLQNVDREGNVIGRMTYGFRGNGKNTASLAVVQAEAGLDKNQMLADDDTKLALTFNQPVPGNYLVEKMRESLNKGLQEGVNEVIERAGKTGDQQELIDGRAIQDNQNTGVEQLLKYIGSYPSISSISYYGDDLLINGRSIRDVYPDIQPRVIKAFRNGIIRSPQELNANLNLRQALDQKKIISAYQSSYYTCRLSRRCR